jgi:hypothetical protein
MSSANQPMSQTLKYLGKGHKNQQKEDSDRSKARLEKLEGDEKK